MHYNKTEYKMNTETVVIAKKTKKPKKNKYCKKCGEESDGFELCEWCEQEELDIEYHRLTEVEPPLCNRCEREPAELKDKGDLCSGCEDKTCCKNKYHKMLCSMCSKCV